MGRRQIPVVGARATPAAGEIAPLACERVVATSQEMAHSPEQHPRLTVRKSVAGEAVKLSLTVLREGPSGKPEMTMSVTAGEHSVVEWLESWLGRYITIVPSCNTDVNIKKLGRDALMRTAGCVYAILKAVSRAPLGVPSIWNSVVEDQMLEHISNPVQFVEATSVVITPVNFIGTWIVDACSAALRGELTHRMLPSWQAPHSSNSNRASRHRISLPESTGVGKSCEVGALVLLMPPSSLHAPTWLRAEFYNGANRVATALSFTTPSTCVYKAIVTPVTLDS